MKNTRFFLLLTLLGAFAACDRREAQQAQQQEPLPPASPQVDENEIERRVQQRLAEERLTEDQRRAREREQDLNKRETALQRRERELREREDAPAPTPAPRRQPAAPEPEPQVPQVADSYQIFYDSLAPYGSWIEVSSYGYVWQPRQARDSRWRPYTDGRWAYTDHGWTWISNEPFGWAAYHYGRWVRLRRLGWCWVPGDQWAPAWVAWRTGNAYVGWAPLPPEARFDGANGIHEWADSRFDIGASDYAFVPATDFGDERVERAVVPPEQNVTIVNETTNVTNIVQKNQVIINNGPNFQTLQARSRRPISQLKIERVAEAPGGKNAAVVKGGTLQLAAPVIRRDHAVAKTARPAQVQQRVEDAKVKESPAPAPPQAAQAATPGPSPTPGRPGRNPWPAAPGARPPKETHAEGSPTPVERKPFPPGAAQRNPWPNAQGAPAAKPRGQAENQGAAAEPQKTGGGGEIEKSNEPDAHHPQNRRPQTPAAVPARPGARPAASVSPQQQQRAEPAAPAAPAQPESPASPAPAAPRPQSPVHAPARHESRARGGEPEASPSAAAPLPENPMPTRRPPRVRPGQIEAPPSPAAPLAPDAAAAPDRPQPRGRARAAQPETPSSPAAPVPGSALSAPAREQPHLRAGQPGERAAQRLAPQNSQAARPERSRAPLPAEAAGSPAAAEPSGDR